ncbi:hypothetical protein BKP45_19385 [Anaerobacillus alkalidiazotrophicus]|uniref:Uncharacterized protein n=1 Tax=Anaerobacillus alkalidiazotrophicus TaxID=472963 RepID=A0A1S2LZS7_9BACI|nr:RsfA family transcriptional regulator [Anaerobacillus alkalidiazotrophicus]OIJ17733.1 hypothetical protein BKP45_19385 [Anaerobacillus alkalidiazotrophicus]
MSIVRQDAWTNDEDLVLAEVVLRHIREGSTQLAAFEEVGERLSRTAAACGFRWNSSIRKKYEAAIAIAKKQRKSLKKNKLEDSIQEFSEEISTGISDVPVSEFESEAQEVVPQPLSMSMEDVIEFLASHKGALESNQSLAEENKKLKEKITELASENERITRELSKLVSDYDVMKQDYKLLIGIMDRAKKMSVT